MRHRAVFDMAARLYYLEPADLTQRARSAADSVWIASSMLSSEETDVDFYRVAEILRRALRGERGSRSFAFLPVGHHRWYGKPLQREPMPARDALGRGPRGV